MITESTAHQRPRNRRNTIHTPQHPRIRRPFRQRHRARDDRIRAGEDACGPDARDGASDDQSGGMRGRGADEGADLEEEAGSKEDVLGGAMGGVELAEGELEGAGRQEVGGCVPADVGEGVEIGCYVWDGGCYDAVVLMLYRGLVLCFFFTSSKSCG